MTVTLYIFTIAIYAVLSGLLILVINSWLLKLEPISPRRAIPRVWNYLHSGLMSVAFAVLLFAVDVAVTGIREQLRSEYGLPNDNVLAYFMYAFLHVDIRHLLENAGLLLICAGIVEKRVGSLWFLVLVALLYF